MSRALSRRAEAEKGELFEDVPGGGEDGIGAEAVAAEAAVMDAPPPERSPDGNAADRAKSPEADKGENRPPAEPGAPSGKSVGGGGPRPEPGGAAAQRSPARDWS